MATLKLYIFRELDFRVINYTAAERVTLEKFSWLFSFLRNLISF